MLQLTLLPWIVVSALQQTSQEEAAPAEEEMRPAEALLDKSGVCPHASKRQCAKCPVSFGKRGLSRIRNGRSLMNQRFVLRYSESSSMRGASWTSSPLQITREAPDHKHHLAQNQGGVSREAQRRRGKTRPASAAVWTSNPLPKTCSNSFLISIPEVILVFGQRNLTTEEGVETHLFALGS